MIWHIYVMSPHTGDVKDIVATYHNRGQAIAALRGYVRRAWAAGSEMQYVLRRG